MVKVLLASWLSWLLRAGSHVTFPKLHLRSQTLSWGRCTPQMRLDSVRRHWVCDNSDEVLFSLVNRGQCAARDHITHKAAPKQRVNAYMSVSPRLTLCSRTVNTLVLTLLTSQLRLHMDLCLLSCLSFVMLCPLVVCLWWKRKEKTDMERNSVTKIMTIESSLLDWGKHSACWWLNLFSLFLC